jgi:hypothetical protein
MKERFSFEESEVSKGPEQHRSFFDGKFAEITGKSLLGMGSVFAVAGIYEFVTGHKVGDLVSAYADKLPDIANWVVSHLDNMPLIMKAGGGSSMIAAGEQILRFNSKSSETSET